MRRSVALVASSLAVVGACARPAPQRASSSVRTTATRAPAAPSAGPWARSSQLTPDVLLARIDSHYRGGLQRCYAARLKRDPRARGKVVVTFTVDAEGRLREGRATGVGKQVATCVERVMTGWEFPRPRSETTFRLALQLRSG